MAFAKWRDRLAGKKVPTHTQPDENDEGYYRIPKREKQSNAKTGQPNGQSKIVGWTPVAYFLDGKDLVGTIGGRDMTANELVDYWTYCCAFPISYEMYVAVAEKGEPWPDLQAAPADTVPASNRDVATTDNQPPAEEVPLGKRLGDGIDAAIGAAPTAVTTEAEAALALGSKNRLAELRLEADREGKALYEPIFKEYKKIYNQWTPMVKRADDKEKALNVLILRFRDAERKRIAAEQEAARKIAEQQEADRLAELERINEANEEAAQRAIAKGEPEPMPEMPEPLPAALPEPVAAAPAPLVGTYGTRTIKEVEKTFLDSITDQDAVYNYFKANPKVIALLIDIASAAVKNGVTVPGTTTRTGLI